MKTTLTGRLVLPYDIKGPVFLIARQPVYKPDLEVYGYELLYRTSTDNFVNVMDGDQATLSVLMNTFSQAGLRIVVGSRKAFINLTRNFLVGRYPIPLPPNQAILEILEDIVLDGELLHALNDLSAVGYQIAMDDVVSAARLARLAGIVRIAKVDISMVNLGDLPPLVDDLKLQKVLLVAEKVETREEFEICQKLGFDLFQGFYFGRPEIVALRKFTTSRMVITLALATLANPGVTLDELERVIAMDVTLGYRLLKLANSGYQPTPVPIHSIRHAITVIGIKQLKNWLRLFLSAKVSAKPDELSILALFRGKMAGLMAQEQHVPDADAYFLAGFFSVLDTLLAMPMGDVLDGVTLDGAITAALLSGDGPMGKVLNAIKALESKDWEPIQALDFERETIRTIYRGAVEWTEAIRKDLMIDIHHKFYTVL